MLYTLKDVESNEIILMTMSQILEEINRDRSVDWNAYDENDFIEGLEWTNYRLVNVSVEQV